jgi:hypothetical protein
MADEHRDERERVEKTSADYETPDTGAAAREATDPSAEGEPEAPPPASQEMGSTADVARAVHDATSERRDSDIPATSDRTATGFTDEAEERVDEPDQPVAEADVATDVAGVPGSVERTHEAEGLTTLEEAVEVPQGQGGDRFSDLMGKRKTVGLTDGEAEELGRMVAEREGQSYWSAQSSREREAPEPES